MDMPARSAISTEDVEPTSASNLVIILCPDRGGPAPVGRKSQHGWTFSDWIRPWGRRPRGRRPS
jgi:hypothetical protein